MNRFARLAVLWVGASVATAQETPEAPPPVETQDSVVVAEAAPAQPPFDVLHNDRLTGDWGGGRTWLEDHGIEFGLSMTNVYPHIVHRGTQARNDPRVTGSADCEPMLYFRR